MIGKVVTGCVAILPYHTATQDRGSECRDFGFISRIVTALILSSQKNWLSMCSDTISVSQTVHLFTYSLVPHLDCKVSGVLNTFKMNPLNDNFLCIRIRTHFWSPW